ncbi:papain-like cysteine protease family protein [Paenibacillus agilis]|uniref:Peptidase C39-like domain-containing protein n=1 Tax=Paenibacillus agilis TaxID=3020863 RepID=A0A559IKS8_9BACL|nr:papain-like cysteine protease family protein [Paenibacillus agilis]TVX88264.1 hypothetical protein FPZ44_20425 [Paenibacillus agilis]
MVARKWKKMIILISAFCTVFTITMVAQVQATNIPSYPAVKQEQSLWCWAGASASILKYYGKHVSQCDIAKAVKGTSTCSDVSASAQETQNGLVQYGISSWMYDGALTYTDVKTQIDNGSRPVYVSWQWSTGGGHVVVIYGYDSVGGNDMLNYMDPLVGRKTSMRYTEFKGGSSYNQTWRWGLKDLYKFN